MGDGRCGRGARHCGGECANSDLDRLLEQVRQEATTEARHDDERIARFAAARDERTALLNKSRAERDAANRRADEMRAQYSANEQALRERDARLVEVAGDLADLFAIMRQTAVSSSSVVRNSVVSIENGGRAEFLTALGKSDRTPAIADIRQFWLALLTEMNESGKTIRSTQPVVTPDGSIRDMDVVRVGVFTIASGDRFLRYLPENGQLLELSRQPSARHRRLLAAFTSATEDVLPVPLDPSKGAILSLMVESPDLREQIAQGGVIGYLILVIGAIGLGLIGSRAAALWIDGRRLARAAREAGKADPATPLGRLRKTAEETTNPAPDILGVRLDEQLAAESARLHRGLATVAVLATVCPLLGLLGTVTGMIETFQSMTLFGTGDPKLMSGGISEALVTTELGLAVAIPLVLLHSLVTGQANRLIEDLGQHASELFSRHVNARAQ